MISVVDYILGRFSQDLAIDLGTANTLVAVGGKGIVIREPSVVTRHKKSKKVIAIGNAAKKMIGRTPLNIETIRPLQEGIICDFDTTLAMLSYFVKQSQDPLGHSISFARPRVVIGVPTKSSDVERRAVIDAAVACGARSVYLVEEPIAAALGAGLAVDEPLGIMIVDIGGGTSEIAVIASSGIVVGRSLKVAGDAMDRDVTGYIRSRYGLTIGEKTAEEIKILLGSAYPMKVEKEMIVRGRDLESGLPKSIRLLSASVREALAPSLGAIISAISEVIADTPPELVGDVAERGIMLCGGGSQLYGLPKLISDETKMPTFVAGDPLTSVAYGCFYLLENQELLNKVKIGKNGSR